MLKRHIYTSTIANKLLVALCILLLPLSSFAQVKKMIVEQPDTTPLFKGVQIMADVVGAVQLAVSDYGQYEAGVRVNLKDKYFPVVEIGYGKADHHNDVTQIDYKTSAPYGKIGTSTIYIRYMQEHATPLHLLSLMWLILMSPTLYGELSHHTEARTSKVVTIG